MYVYIQFQTVPHSCTVQEAIDSNDMQIAFGGTVSIKIMYVI